MGGVVGTGAALTFVVGLVIWLLARVLRVGDGDKDHPGPDDRDDLDYQLACAILGATWAVMEANAQDLSGLLEDKLTEARLRSPEFMTEVIIFMVILPLHITIERGCFRERWRNGSLMFEVSQLYLEALREKLRESGVSQSEKARLAGLVPHRLAEFDEVAAGSASSHSSILALGDLAVGHLLGRDGDPSLGLVVGMYLQTHFTQVGSILGRLEADFSKRGREALVDPNVQGLVGR